VGLNIIFDLLRVIVNYDQAALIAEVFPDPAMHAVVRADILGHVDWLALDRGTLSLQDAVGRAARRTGLSKATVATFLQQVPPPGRANPGTVDLLYRLRAKGYPPFCSSNLHVASIEYLENAYPFWEVFAGRVVSCRVHLLKPEQAIYVYLLAQCGLEDPHTVFIDDTEANLEAAAQFGLNTIKFENPTPCERQLQTLGCI
jgi:putative hydrolase of the HAD superfamily